MRDRVSILPFSNFRELVESPHGKVDSLTKMHDDYLVSLNTSFLRPSTKIENPTRFDCVRFGVLKEGYCSPSVNGKNYHCLPGDFIMVNWGAVIESDYFSDDVMFEGIVMHNDYLQTIFQGDVPPIFADANQCIVLHLSEEEQKVINEFLRLVHAMTSDSGLTKITEEVLRAMLRYIKRLNELYVGGMDLGDRKGDAQLLDDFMALIDKHVAREHQIDFYASALLTTPNYLGTRVMKASGETPKMWIDKALVSKAKVELKCTVKPLKQVSDDLGFPSMSSFCKFFKRMTGETAMAFRKR